MEAYQSLIRKEMSKTEQLDFDINLVDLKKTIIRIIDKKTASDLIIKYEWLHTIPYITKYNFGIYFNIEGKDILGGVLMFSPDYAENTGIWNKYSFDDKVLLLSRGVCLWWTPKNTASYFIRRACKLIKENTKYRIVTATVDPVAGEIGIIYQSLNWIYVGLMSGNYYHSKETKRFSVLIDGKLRYSRWIRNKLGTMKKEVILKHYPNAIFVSQYRKRRYFYFMDTSSKNKIYFNAIKHLIQPYPKRNIDVIGIIYAIENKINNKKYVGQTVRSLADRINDYKSGMGNDYLNNSFKKYGFNNFEFKIIDTASTIEELNAKEIQYILNYKSNNKEFGYNIESGGKNAIPDVDTLEKMSKSHLGMVQSDEWVDKRIAKAGSKDAKKYGKEKTEEEKLKLSIKSPKYWQGKNRNEETKNKISKTKKENGLSEKQKTIICKKVYKVDFKTNKIIERFESTANASKTKGVNQSTISRWCSKNKVINNILWRY
jgi:group I intron endonuclease